MDRISDILIISNNKEVLDLENQCQGVKVQYMNVPVRDILKLVQEKMTSKSLKLLCNPLCGRSARPFPYISLLLTSIDYRNTGEFNSKPSDESNVVMWNDIMTFELMDERNRKVYEKYPKEILEDFAILDKDLVESAVERL